MKIYTDIYSIFMCIYTAAVDTNMVIKTWSQVFFQMNTSVHLKYSRQKKGEKLMQIRKKKTVPYVNLL